MTEEEIKMSRLNENGEILHEEVCDEVVGRLVWSIYCPVKFRLSEDSPAC